MADEPGTFLLQDIHVDTGTVDVVHVNFAAPFRRKVVALIDEQTRVGVAAAGRRRTTVAGVWAVVAGPMDVVGDGLDVVKNVRIEMRTGLASEVAALNHV